MLYPPSSDLQGGVEQEQLLHTSYAKHAVIRTKCCRHRPCRGADRRHASGVGTVRRGDPGNLLTHVAYVFGTSACTMSSINEGAFVRKAFFFAMLPGLWLNEGGKSAAGAAIDHLAACISPQKRLRNWRGQWERPQQFAVDWAERQGGLPPRFDLIGDLHVVPEFIGNRSPFADPDARGLIAGLRRENELDSLVTLYLARMCGLGYGTRQMVRSLHEKGGQSTRLSSAAVRARVSWRFSLWPMRLDKSWQRQPQPSLCFSGPLCWARWPRAAILVSSARCRPCGKSAGHSRSRRRSRLRRLSPSRHSTTLGGGTLIKLPTSARRRLCPANPFPCEPHRALERRSLMRPLRLSRGRGAIATTDCGRGGSLADRAAQRGRTRAG